jgi:hypothetical protein
VLPTICLIPIAISASRQWPSGRVTIFPLSSRGSNVAMSPRERSILKVLLTTLCLWTTLCSSYGLSLSDLAVASTDLDNLHQRTGNVQPPSNVKTGGTTSIATNISYSSARSGDPPASQTECSYILRSYTYWPGPSVITEIGETICPSLASTTTTSDQRRISKTDVM